VTSSTHTPSTCLPQSTLLSSPYSSPNPKPLPSPFPPLMKHTHTTLSLVQRLSKDQPAPPAPAPTPLLPPRYPHLHHHHVVASFNTNEFTPPLDGMNPRRVEPIRQRPVIGTLDCPCRQLSVNRVSLCCLTRVCRRFLETALVAFLSLAEFSAAEIRLPAYPSLPAR
jgi:hypothetical protein